ncbi:MAG: hypothetical protein ACFFFK_01935 [Candidatus Thorarchaeota archaeon]
MSKEEEAILSKPAETWDQYALRALLYSRRMQYRQATLDIMNAYALNPSSLSVQAIWIRIWAIANLSYWQTDSESEQDYAIDLWYYLINSLLRKSPNREVYSDKEWSWVPESFEDEKVLVFMSTMKHREEWISEDLYSKAIDDLNNIMTRLGPLEPDVLEQVKSHLQKDLDAVK